MDRFLKYFYQFQTGTLIKEINQYAEDYNLKIISITANESLRGAIVLFERIRDLNTNRF